MNIEALVSSDLQEHAAATSRRLHTPVETRQFLAMALARREEARAARRRPMLAAAVAVGAAALVVPVPYPQQTGWDATFRSRSGRTVTVKLAARDAAEAERRARLLAGPEQAAVSVRPRTELVWSSVYARARAKLFHIDVDARGKTDAQAEAEIRKQLLEQGWTAGEVRVERTSGFTDVELGATDADGRHIRLMRTDEGEGSERIQLRPEPFDDTREPGMTDAQLREKILAQLRARGLEGDVTVEGDRIRVQVRRDKPR